MDVRIVEFPTTRVASVEHPGTPALEHETVRRLIAWRIENRLPPNQHATYGVHYTDPRTTPPDEHRVDLCVALGSTGPEVAPNAHGVLAKTLPRTRCAMARHRGSRDHVTTAAYLAEVWLPTSGERVGDFPIFFHYVNVGPTFTCRSAESAAGQRHALEYSPTMPKPPNAAFGWPKAVRA